MAAAFGSIAAENRVTIALNPAWRFHLGDPPDEAASAGYDDSKWDIVSLPHSHELFAGNMAGFEEHGRNVGWYRRELQVPAEWMGKRMFLEFRGAMEDTTLWVNGEKVGEYAVA